MREIVSRLRAALTPQAAVIITALLLAGLLMFWRGEDAQSLESRIARTLSAVEGAGRVEVTIRMRDVRVSGASLGAEQTQSVPSGAVAVAQGADDPLVAMQLQEALCALLGLSPASVSVMTGGK
ncbi:MAG: hypothetical protein IJ313_02230 [Clostridia bacterium]|nr:hypothetical protein [Clostridia bacterium]